ncbi:hypothetical protein BGZ58_002803, partial [Dissophora ornata]
MTTDRLTALPTECLELVLQQLADDGDAASLGALLRVSRHLYSAILPFLYSAPFNRRLHARRHTLAASMDRITADEPSSSVPTSWPLDTQPERRSLLKLTRLLLSCIPASACSGLLRAAYLSKAEKTEGQDDPRNKQPSSTLINYTSFLTSLKLECLYSALFDNATVGPDANPQVKTYMEEHGLFRRYMDERMRAPERNVHERRLYVMGLRADLRRDLIWTLCSVEGVAEKIRSLAIPLTDIQLYRDSIHRFKALSDLTFIVEQPLWADDPIDADQDPDVIEVSSGLILTRKTRQLLEDMLEFTKQHQQLFKGVLQYVVCVDSDRLYPEGYHAPVHCPESYLERLCRSLPPLRNPRRLDLQNSDRFAANIQETNLEHVRTILWDDAVYSSTPVSRSMKRIEAHSPLLERCRSLEVLHTVSMGDHMFRWAVQEKKQYDAYHAQDCNTRRDRHLGRVEFTADPAAPRSLVPLKKTQIWLADSTTGQEINDAVFGFCTTLETLAARVHDESDDASEELCVGQDWPSCPRLQSLCIDSGSLLLDLHAAALSHGDFTTLETLVLHDRRILYDPRETKYFCPAYLPKLKILDLQGTSALSFNPETLRSTTILTRMTVGPQFIWRQTYIPPVSLLEEAAAQDPPRPLWTWDWNLPHLTELCLGSVFAFEFQFRMLEKTPELELLILHIYTRSHKVERFLDETTLCVQADSGIIGCEDLEATDPETFLRLAKLQEFRLFGKWHLPPRFWQTLCRQSAPNLERIEEYKCDGFTHQDWMEATSRLESLRWAHSSLTMKARIARNLGLQEVDPNGRRHEGAEPER